MSIKGTVGSLNTLKELYKENRLGDPRVQFVEVINYAIKHLEEYEKYKKIFEELEEMFTPGKIFYISKNKNFEEHTQKIMDLKYIIDELKEKYFPEPEPIKKTMIIEVEADNEDVLKGELNFLKAFLERNKDVLQCKYKIREERNKKGGKFTC